MFGRSSDQEKIDELTLRVAELERTVERLARQAGIPSTVRGGPQVSEEVRALAMQGKTIHAVKRLREETGLGLRAAKEVVDRLPRP